MFKSIMGKLSLALLVVVSISVHGAEPSEATAQSLKIKRSLHPMPHELKISGAISEIVAGDCAIELSFNASPKEKQIIDMFKENWQKEYKVPLKESDGRLTIVAGVLKNSATLEKAALNGVFDAKYLSERPSSEQAYSISSVTTDGKLTVYIAANDNTGLYYGLLTFKQLLSSLSEGGKLVFPHCQITDWPDIQERGIGIKVKEEEHLRRLSEMKLNVNCFWMWMSVSEEGNISYSEKYHDFSLLAGKYNVIGIPYLIHMDYLFNKGWGMDKFPELAAHIEKLGETEYGSASGKTFCYSNPKTQDVLDKIFEAIATAEMGNRLKVGMGETGNRICHCPVCKGDREEHYINEIKHIIHAYEKARLINPDLKMDITLSQGTWPHNYAVVKNIPRDVGIIIYSGSGEGNTYKTTQGEYVLTQQAEEFVSMGYGTGIIASYGPALLWKDIIFPTYMPQFTKLRMSEIKDKGLHCSLAWMSSCFNQELNLEAYAEFSWNTNGRTSAEFIASWAQRKKLPEPDKVAQVIKTLEYPIRAISSGMKQRTMTRSVERMVSILNGEKPKWGSYFDALSGFEYHNNEELLRVKEKCEETLKLSTELKNEELTASSLLLKQWVSIIERYAFFLESKEKAEKQKARNEIFALSSGLPELWKRWIDTQNLAKKEYKASHEGCCEVMKEFERLKQASSNGK